ncbi:MAG: nicotinate-nicotinamide nucleotide adenylyltransferase, partial [Chloroflexi bacterium]|nr:nicotinate-nicotinamide nucleotide adenylyltransferase [Chloroflexota bacterium]
ATIATFTRPGKSNDFQPEWLDSITPGASATIQIVEGIPVAISGTEIRQRIAEGRSIRYRVPDTVADYIAEHNLYR